MKALASSSVKIKGTDVVASHKIVCSFVAFPVFSVVWTSGFHLILKEFTDLDPQTIRIITVVYFVIWPFYSYGIDYFSIIIINF